MTDVTIANDLFICANYLQSRELIAGAQAYFADRSIPLNDRWQLFYTAGKLVGNKIYRPPRMRTVLNDFFEEEWGPLQICRHQEMNTIDMVDIFESFIVNEEYHDYESEIIEWAEATRIRDIKKEVLSMFLWSFKLDY